MPFHLTPERLAELLTDERLAKLDPPLPDENYTPILPPDPLPKRVYHQESIEELSIQKAMEMEGDTCAFMYLMLLIRHTAKSITDINVPYWKQDSEVLRLIRKELLDRAPVFYNYEDAWPITAYLRLAMKGHRRSDARTPMPPLQRSPAPALSSGRATPHPNCATVVISRRRGSVIVLSDSESEDDAFDDNDEDDKDASEYANECGFAESVDSTKDIDLTASKGARDSCRPSRRQNRGLGVTASESRFSTASIPPSTPSLSASSSASTSASSPSPDLSAQSPRRYASTHTLSTLSRAQSLYTRTFSTHPRATPLPSAPPAPTSSIAARLAGLAVPPADVEYIVRVLASIGVTDVAYLRVMGRMALRDAWLEELRAAGRLTEVQVRVVVCAEENSRPTKD